MHNNMVQCIVDVSVHRSLPGTGSLRLGKKTTEESIHLGRCCTGAAGCDHQGLDVGEGNTVAMQLIVSWGVP